MSDDIEKNTSLKFFYRRSFGLMLIFMIIFSIVGWIFSSTALQNIASEINSLLFTIGFSYYFLLDKRDSDKESNIKFSRNNFFLIICLLFTLYTVLSLFMGKSSPFDSLYSYGILTLIICLFSVRYVLFRLFPIFQKRMKVKENNVLSTSNASLLSYFIFSLLYYFIICFSSINFTKISVFVIMLVSAFYDLVKINYLSPSIDYVEGDESKNINKSLFTEIINADLSAWTIVIIMFYLYYYNIFNISNCQTLYYFYSSIAQMFAAIVGIVAAFSIFILQKYDGENEVKRNTLKNGVTGFLIIYIFIIILAVTGILISNDTIPVNILLLQNDTNIVITRDLISPIIFEVSLLMFPIALLYLYAMIVTFLKFDDIGESVYELY